MAITLMACKGGDADLQRQAPRLSILNLAEK